MTFQPRILIISDDTEFARTLMARWQAERHVPSITLVGSAVWGSAARSGHPLVIVGPVKDSAAAILDSLGPEISAVCVCPNGDRGLSLRGRQAGSVIVPMADGWMDAVVTVASESLRRMEGEARAREAERAAAAQESEATLGRYMLEMRHGINNALTSVLGNADLLLMEPGSLSAQAREQIKTIHTMTLRLNEVMQRFSSLANEMRLGEKESQAETAELEQSVSSDR